MLSILSPLNTKNGVNGQMWMGYAMQNKTTPQPHIETTIPLEPVKINYTKAPAEEFLEKITPTLPSVIGK